MNTFTALNKALRANGWSFDPDDEDFCDQSGKLVSYSKPLEMVPGTIEFQIATWAEARREKI